MPPVTIATYNVENLFTRARLFNFASVDTAKPKLKKVGELDTILRKAAYDADDKRAILKILADLKDFITIREDRERLLSFRRPRRVVADGAGDWDGEIVFKRARFNEIGRKATADVIRKTRADILCMVEVEDRPTLKSFDTHLLRSRYPYEIVIDGNDPRGIDVGLYSEFPITDVDTHIWDKEKPSSRSFIFSRDCLEVEVAVPDGPPVHVLVNHLKSKFGGDSDDRRKLQATRVKEILGRYDLTQDRVVVAGDLNDTPDSAPLRPLLGVDHLTDVFDLAGIPQDDRWTFKDKKQQLDYLLVSDPLCDALDPNSVTILRHGIFFRSQADREAHGTPEEITSHANAASDHAAVAATFNL